MLYGDINVPPVSNSIKMKFLQVCGPGSLEIQNTLQGNCTVHTWASLEILYGRAFFFLNVYIYKMILSVP